MASAKCQNYVCVQPEQAKLAIKRRPGVIGMESFGIKVGLTMHLSVITWWPALFREFRSVEYMFNQVYI